jgi:serine/threonine-protein kinase
MGEVYKARDTKLGREVAIKVLPEAFAENKERLARFEREARLLASLNHPNIATLHGLEESDGIHFLVMELVPGETLAERIAPGPLPVDEALSIFRQIAEALEAAHEKSIIHRDLKPANIKVTPEGKVKVLDFGLAKALVDADHDPGRNGTGSPPRHCPLHEPRAGAREISRQEDRRLVVWLCSLRGAHGPKGFPGRNGHRYHRRHRQERSGLGIPAGEHTVENS